MSPWRRRGRPPLAKLKPPEDAPRHPLHPHARNRAKTPLIELKIADTQVRQPVHPRRQLPRPGLLPDAEAIFNQSSFTMTAMAAQFHLRHGLVQVAPRPNLDTIRTSGTVIRRYWALAHFSPGVDVPACSILLSVAVSASICFFPDRIAKWCGEIRQVLRISLGKL
nr:uncharacterized protein LOC127301607 isoform X1 [Lolium perenne]XP_051187840.1 uncharacterized protein LOC127301607 isoform X2 [Lolium perenne]